MIKTKFFFALLSVLAYEVMIRFVGDYGLSFAKLAITILLWISFILALSTFITEYQAIKQLLPPFAFYTFLALLGWNLVCILRSVLTRDGTITTLLGNPETSLALLTPFCLAFSSKFLNIININKFYMGVIAIAVPVYVIFIVASHNSTNIVYNKVFEFLLYNTAFFIVLIPFQSANHRILVIIGSIAFFYVAIVLGYRIINVRIVLLFFSVFLVWLYKRFNLKIILIASMLCIAVPFYLLLQGIQTGESPFVKYRPETSNEELTDDTRTFLYREVFADLKKNNALLMGKGSNGAYYSPYFDENGEDTAYRLSPEVGILAMLLKGGAITVLLNLTILLTAIYLALFRTNNYFVLSLGFMLIIHTIILFITDYLDYSSYNVALWFFIGVCLTKPVRHLNNMEIKNFLLNGDSIS